MYQNLTRLYLSGCQLSKLPDGLEKIQLETLSLESNKFREVPSILCKMVSLKCLYLRQGYKPEVRPEAQPEITRQK